MWRNSRLTTPQKRQSDCRRLGHSRLRVASRFTLRIGLASWQTQPPSHAKIAGGPPSLGVHEPSDSPQVTSCHSGTPLCARPKLTKLSARGLCKLRAEHYWDSPLSIGLPVGISDERREWSEWSGTPRVLSCGRSVSMLSVPRAARVFLWSFFRRLVLLERWRIAGRFVGRRVGFRQIGKFVVRLGRHTTAGRSRSE